MSNFDVLPFEEPVAEFEAKIRALQSVSDNLVDADVQSQIAALKVESERVTRKIFSDLRPDQILQVARHVNRPHTVDYLQHTFEDFTELHGDRSHADGRAIIGGLARIDGRSVMVIGQEKGRETEDRIKHNFGMPQPWDYRKALRLMEMAERYRVPVVTLIDTPGAYPGIDAEKANQSEAIARNLLVMSRLKTPIICAVIGEGCSGGALGIGVGDYTIMLQYSIYTVISPEGCASILWKTAEKAAEAARAMGITAQDLHGFGLIDEIVEEPLGGAHRGMEQTAQSLRQSLVQAIDRFSALSNDDLLEKRYSKLMLETATLSD